jgi:hypothetical protein
VTPASKAERDMAFRVALAKGSHRVDRRIPVAFRIEAVLSFALPFPKCRPHLWHPRMKGSNSRVASWMARTLS